MPKMALLGKNLKECIIYLPKQMHEIENLAKENLEQGRGKMFVNFSEQQYMVVMKTFFQK